MPAQVRGIRRHCDVVTRADRDPVVAAGAHVVLGGFVRLNQAYLDHSETAVPQTDRHPSSAHANRPITASAAATTKT